MPPPQSPISAPSPLLRRLTSPLAAGAVLVVAWFVLVGSIWNKSLTYDEMVPPAAGYAYWKYGDFRLNPENGNLPQRLAALPLLGANFPAPESLEWRRPIQQEFGDQFFHHIGNDTDSLLRRGRAASAVLAVALCALVWAIARQLFGPVGGMTALLLCAFNPTLLANGPLMTSETAAAFFFLAATWTWWRLMQRVTPGRLLVSALSAAGLLVSKMSAGLLLPIALILTILRLAQAGPLEVVLASWRRQLTTRGQQALAFAAAGLLQAIIAYVVLWGFYGFRYSMLAPDQPTERGTEPFWQAMLGHKSLPELIEEVDLPAGTREQARQVTERLAVPVYGWSNASEFALAELQKGVLTPAQVGAIEERRRETEDGVAGFIAFLARHEVFPEAYLYGTLHVWRFAQMRPFFLDGEYRTRGTIWFFPYTFAVKTPLAVFGLMALAIAAVWAARSRAGGASPGHPGTDRFWYETAPLWILMILYWLTVLSSKLNIGHRHLIPAYPPLLVLCGAAGLWIEGLFRSRGDSGEAAGSRWRGSRAAWATICLLGILLVEVGWRFPNYLAYFNGVIAPSRAYRHFVDSTLDWGQELPGARDYIATHPAESPFYLSYFGTGDPRAYGIEAEFLPSSPGFFRAHEKPILFERVSANPPPPDELARVRARASKLNFIGIGILNNAPHAVLARPREALRLRAGTYLISATSLQARYSEHEDGLYQELNRVTRPYLSPQSPEDAAAVRQRGLGEWRDLLNTFEDVRFRRLCSYLRQFDPDAQIGHSMLVFKVSEQDLVDALEGPPLLEIRYRGQTLSEARRAR